MIQLVWGDTWALAFVKSPLGIYHSSRVRVMGIGTLSSVAWGTGWSDEPDLGLGGSPVGPDPSSRVPTVLLSASSPAQGSF